MITPFQVSSGRLISCVCLFASPGCHWRRLSGVGRRPIGEAAGRTSEASLCQPFQVCRPALGATIVGLQVQLGDDWVDWCLRTRSVGLLPRLPFLARRSPPRRAHSVASATDHAPITKGDRHLLGSSKASGPTNRECTSAGSTARKCRSPDHTLASSPTPFRAVAQLARYRVSRLQQRGRQLLHQLGSRCQRRLHRHVDGSHDFAAA